MEDDEERSAQRDGLRALAAIVRRLEKDAPPNTARTTKRHPHKKERPEQPIR